MSVSAPSLDALMHLKGGLAKSLAVQALGKSSSDACLWMR
jgi:hypothetical protein